MTDFDTLPTVTVSRETTVGGAALWRVLSDLGALPEWAPGIDGAEVTSEKTSGTGAVRRAVTAQFGPIEHRFTEWDDGHGFAYETADSGPFSRTLTVYRIEPLGDDAATVSVSLAFEVKPGAIAPDQARAILTKALTATLKELELRARVTLPA